MALSARATNMNAAPSASSGRVPSGARHIASLVGSETNEIDLAVDVQPNTRFNFHGYSDWTKREQTPTSQPLTNTSSNFETFSSLFVNMLDNEQVQGKVRGPASDTKPASAKFISKAIRAYEGTALVINGPRHSLGTSLSIFL